MINNRPWDIYESALLLEACLKIEAGELSVSTACDILSKNLRLMAIKQGENVSDTFRNYNGISWQISLMRKALHADTHSVLHLNSEFRKIVDMYFINTAAYKCILKEAHDKIANKTNTQSIRLAPMKSFEQWLVTVFGNKNEALDVLALFHRMSNVSKGYRKLDCMLWDIMDEQEYINALNEIEQNSYITHAFKDLFKKFNKVAHYYSDYLKSAEFQEFRRQQLNADNSSGAVQDSPSSSSVDQQYNINMNSTAKSSFLQQRVDFNNLSDLSYTKPTFIVVSQKKLIVDSWKDVYLSLLKELRNDYKRLFYSLCNKQASLVGDGRPDFCFESSISRLRRAAFIGAGSFVETNLSANDMMRRIKQLLEMCNISSGQVEIYYVPSANRTTSSADIKHDESNVLSSKAANQTIIQADENSEKDKSFSHVAESRLRDLLIANFSHGFRLHSIIENVKLRNIAQQNGLKLSDDDSILLNQLEHLGVISNQILYIVTDNAKDSIIKIINSISDAGNIIAFYEQILSAYNSDFVNLHIFDSATLKAYIEYCMPNVHTSKNFISFVGKISEKDAIISEIKRAFGDADLMRYSELCSLLPFIPTEKITYHLSISDAFTWDSDDIYFNISRFVLSQNQRELLEQFIYDECTRHGFTAFPMLPLQDIQEENFQLSQYSIYKAIEVLVLKDKYAVSGKIITFSGASVSDIDLLISYCKGKDICTFDELEAYSRNLIGEANRQHIFQALYDNMVRIDKDKFVSDNQVSFDIKQIDFALSQMISSPIVSLSNIVSFALFPFCGYTWNSFLLESYCYRFSELYRYETLSFNDKNAGVIILRNLKTNYKNILARVVAESGIILSQDSVISYLCQNGYIAKRRYASVDEVIEMAKVLRQEKK